MKESIKWTIASFVILFLAPFLVAKFAGVNGMALCFILFFAINPLFFIFEGFVSGKEIKKHWFLPLDSALIYLLSMWIIFDLGEIAFVLYTCTYLLIGVITMLVTYALRHEKN